MGFLTDAINLGGPAYIAERGIQNVQDQSQQARQTAQAGATQMQNQTQFKPFAVTSGVGSAGLNAQGNINMNLNAQTQDLQNQLQQSGLGMLGQQQSLADTFGQTSGALGLGDVGAERGELLRNLQGELGAAGLDPTNRSREQDLIGTLQGGGQGQQDIFNQLEALQAGGREQDRLGLEERLFAQGRGGVRTAQFGGTPEQLAMAQAQEQARLGNAAQSYQLAQQSQNQASQQALAGIQQAGAETGMFADIGFQGGNAALQNLQAGSGAQQAAAQTALQTQAQLANLGQSQIQGSFDPQRMLLEQMDAANQTGSLVSAGQRTGAQLGASMLQAGMGTQADLSKLEGDLRQQQMSGLVSLLTSGQANNPNGAGLLEQILGKIL
jgi:hypothetical protein